jgi:hypothetical protein
MMSITELVGTVVILFLILMLICGVSGYLMGLSDGAAPIPEHKSICEKMCGSNKEDEHVIEIPSEPVPEPKRTPSFREALKAGTSEVRNSVTKEKSNSKLLEEEDNTKKTSKKKSTEESTEEKKSTKSPKSEGRIKSKKSDASDTAAASDAGETKSESKTTTPKPRKTNSGAEMDKSPSRSRNSSPRTSEITKTASGSEKPSVAAGRNSSGSTPRTSELKKTNSGREKPAVTRTPSGSPRTSSVDVKSKKKFEAPQETEPTTL